MLEKISIMFEKLPHLKKHEHNYNFHKVGRSFCQKIGHIFLFSLQCAKGVVYKINRLFFKTDISSVQFGNVLFTTNVGVYKAEPVRKMYREWL